MNRRLFRRGVAGVALVATCALALAGCGGTTKSSTESSQPSSAASPTSSAAAPSSTAGGASSQSASAAVSSSATAASAAQGSATQSSASASGAASGAAMKKGLTVAFLPKQVNNPYFNTTDTGGKKALTELGETYKEVGPSNAGASAQVSYINALTQQHVDAIVISADDPNAVCPALKQAMAAGIKVVTFDSDAPTCRDIFVNQASAEALGRSEVDLLAKQINNTGDIAILSATPTATNQNTWIGFMKDELTKPEYKNMKLVKIAYGNDDDQTSFQQTQGLLSAYPDLKGIISPTTVGIAAAARYISSSPYKGKVALTGLGTPNQMRKFVQDGTVQAFELWDPGKLGYLAAYTAVALVSGVITNAQGQSFTAGSLGKYAVGADQQILLGPPTVFNKSNIDNFNF